MRKFTKNIPKKQRYLCGFHLSVPIHGLDGIHTPLPKHDIAAGGGGGGVTLPPPPNILSAPRHMAATFSLPTQSTAIFSFPLQIIGYSAT